MLGGVGEGSDETMGSFVSSPRALLCAAFREIDSGGSSVCSKATALCDYVSRRLGQTRLSTSLTTPAGTSHATGALCPNS